MNKNKQLAALAAKGIIYIYLPAIGLLYIIYEVVLKKDMIFPWKTFFIYASLAAISTIRNYGQTKIEKEVKDFKSLKSSIIEGKWKIIQESENTLIVDPKFDFPFKFWINNKVEIDYSEKKAVITGPLYYVNNIVKDINGQPSTWGKKVTNIVALIIVLALVSIPIFQELGIPLEIKKKLHNHFVKKVQVIEIQSDGILGNSIQNINNQGHGVENEDYIFYVENHLNLVRVNKEYGDKTYLIQKSEGSNISRLNLAGDWIFYTRGEALNRIRIDGTDDETIYKSGYALDLHLKDNWLYFINLEDNFNVYKIDINGRGLQRFLDLSASDIALYDNKMIVSYDSNGKSYVESISLDGVDRKLELEAVANNLVKWDGYYYFIGEDHKLYRNKTDGITAPELLVDEEVSSYVITDDKIFYSLHSGDVGYPGQNIFKINLDGTHSSLIFNTERVEGFTKVGDFIIFHSSEGDYESKIKRLNILTNEIELME